MKRIIVAVDSFKGSLTSAEVNLAVESGLRGVWPECQIERIRIADGGEGTVDALVETLCGEWVEAECHDPLMRPLRAKYGIINGGTTAVMEMASTGGLPLLAMEERNPLKTTTYGFGEMIVDALERGCREFLLGIGGSATNDAGVGMLQALGYRMLDDKGCELRGGGEILNSIVTIDDSGAHPALKVSSFTVACDVDNPFYGEMGAAHIFAPQKGADATMVAELDKGLRNMAKVIRRYNNVSIDNQSGAGAAGGLGGALYAILNSRLQRGIDMVLEAIGFIDRVKGCDLVITGEGRIDKQTLMGKAPYGVMRLAKLHGVESVAIAGSVKWCKELQESDFLAIMPVISGPILLEEAMQRDVAIDNISRTARQIARLYSYNKQ